MWLRNKLRREQANLLTLKSRLIFYFNILFICIVAILFCHSTVNAKIPDGDTMSSSGSYSSSDLYDSYAKQEECTYIVYCLDGGAENPFTIREVHQGETVKLRKPYRCGYYFKGWYLNHKYTKEVSSIEYSGNKAIVVYARWSRVLDNYKSVENYKYTSNKKLSPETVFLKDCKYNFCEDVLIPGMPSTKDDDWFNDFIFSKSQCPQGICFTDDYILITSYSDEDDCLGSLMVIDKDTGDYLFTLGMDPASHLGGIAFDGENVWVCNSSKNAIERISYDFIQLMASQNSGEVVDATEVVDIYKVSNVPSCITYYGNRLWIATHTKFINSKMKAYFYDKKSDSLKTLSTYKIPAKVQGIAFDEDGAVYLSTSYGRRSSSYIRKYFSVIQMASKTDSPAVSIEMPPGSEEIDINDGKLSVIFESAGEKYFEGTDGKGVSTSPIDKILQIDLDSL